MGKNILFLNIQKRTDIRTMNTPPLFLTSSREKRMSIDRHGDEKAKELPSYGFIFPSYVRSKIIC